MGAILDEKGITGALANLVNHLETENTEQAEAVLDILDFERLLRPMQSISRQPQFIDPAKDFGLKRVHETGELLRSCVRQLSTGNLQSALTAARAAEGLWRQRDQ